MPSFRAIAQCCLLHHPTRNPLDVLAVFAVSDSARCPDVLLPAPHLCPTTTLTTPNQRLPLPLRYRTVCLHIIRNLETMHD